MRTNIIEDNLYKQLQEAWINNGSSIEEASEDDKNVFFDDSNIVDVKGKGTKLLALVKGEDGQDAHIELIVPLDYIRYDGDKKRLSSRFVTITKSNFNKGLYANGRIDVSSNYTAPDENRPTNKLREIKILPKDTQLPRYSKSGVDTLDVKDQLVTNGVKIAPGVEPKKAVITNSSGKAVIVNVNGAAHYLIGFEMGDEHPLTHRVDGEGSSVVVATMPVPMTMISSDGLIDPKYVNEFVKKWNSGKRYVWDGNVGHVEKVEDPAGSMLSSQELATKLVDLDRFKPEFKAGDVGTQGADPQRHRLQNLAQKKLIDDSDIAKAEKKNGKPFTKKEFNDFVRGKGIIPPDVIKKDEFGKRLFARWKQKNPRLASYIKAYKENMKKFAADKDKFENPAQAQNRMAQAHDAEEVVIADLDFADVPEEAYATSAI